MYFTSNKAALKQLNRHWELRMAGGYRDKLLIQLFLLCLSSCGFDWSMPFYFLEWGVVLVGCGALLLPINRTTTSPFVAPLYPPVVRNWFNLLPPGIVFQRNPVCHSFTKEETTGKTHPSVIWPSSEACANVYIPFAKEMSLVHWEF